jgi:hypothetical protein
VKSQRTLLVLSWTWVAVPLAYGLYRLILNATKLFA